MTATTNPRTYANLEQAIAQRAPFDMSSVLGGLSLAGHNLWVLSTHDSVSGPLAEYVTESQRILTERYMAAGHREPLPRTAVYYVREKIEGRVLGIVCADGAVLTASDLSGRIAETVRSALNAAAERVIRWGVEA